jgi:hypothetical protein
VDSVANRIYVTNVTSGDVTVIAAVVNPLGVLSSNGVRWTIGTR